MANLPANRKLSSRVRRVAGRQRGQENQAPSSSGSQFAHRFMKHKFWPVCYADRPELAKYGKVQQSFFNSAKNVASLYKLTIPDTAGIPYPLNVHHCFVHLQEQLAVVSPDLSLAIMQGADQPAVVTVLKPVKMECQPYHIPLYPIYKMLRNKKCKRINPVILGILAMLYDKFEFSHYRDPDSYMWYMYQSADEMLQEDIFDSPSPEDYNYLEDEITFAYKVGDQVIKRVRNFIKYQRFPVIVSRFKPRTPIEKELKALAVRFIALDLTYPDKQLVEDIPEGWLDPEQDQRVHKNMLFSFVFGDGSYLDDSAISFIDADFQNAYGLDIPLAAQYFDQPQTKECLDLTYEQSCIQLIDDFDNIIRKLRNGKY